MLFWIIAVSLALFCSAVLGFAVLRRHAGAEPPEAYDLRVYRDQLREVDRDLARGVIGEEDAERVRAEVSRRILAADARLRERGDSGGQPRAAGWAAVALASAVLIGGGGLLYSRIGEPGYEDLPLKTRIAASDAARADRLNQSEAEARVPERASPEGFSADYLALMEKLRQTVADRPDDPRGLALLARNEAALGNYAAARKAQQRLIEVRGPDATAGDYAELVDLMVTAAAGYVSSDAERAIRNALQRAPRAPRARYYLGLYLLQVDRPDMAFRTWKRLLDESRPEAPWVPAIRARIGEVAWRAGVKFELPPLEQPPGPGAADMEAAADMSGQERAEMIRGMVTRLADRLDSEGGTAQEWARLIGAYGVLGEDDRARAAWEEARQIFAAREQELAVLRDAARNAGLIE